ncbi:MAG TPA: Hsp20/alpha crystallin family protein [Candidatus Glassbacteria bacterium]|nr:Hsp20/alpha crystallin family protein [Candidatus Glassbacteria bacterium]
MLSTRHSLLNNFFDYDYATDGVAYQKKDDKLVVFVDVPGVKKEDLIVESINNTIRIETDRKLGISQGKSTKAFSINNRYDLSSLEGALEDGVLRLTIKEKESVKPKQIPIRAIT